MGENRKITIVGGGLAGLALGIGLRREDTPVEIWEAGNYPRHRVCGEFMCGQGPGVLDRFGALACLRNAGAVESHTASFFAGKHRSPVRELSTPAFCLSRFVMDAQLASEFRNLGGHLRCLQRWSCPKSEGVVLASGRRASPTSGGWRWFGLKAHAQDVPLEADLEMHVSDEGYVGINRVEDRRINVCGLFRARAGRSLAQAPLQLLRGSPGSSRFQRLSGARFEEDTLCAVAGLDPRPSAFVDGNIRIGDALTMIPPVTGNGMSLALESAEIAAGPLVSYSRGDITWREAAERIRRLSAAAFSRRLAWARRLQWLMFSPVLFYGTGRWILDSKFLWKFLFARTR